MPGLRAGLLARLPALPAQGAASRPAARLLTLHNLAYVERLMAALREAIGEGRLGEAVAAARGGAAPWELETAH